ncbi:hypothetical protein CAPTEDRAFT_223549 [Capitella teleta]|uniref:Rab-GAP TBC domain-containing protein n=1 Tax=Capitella teleta TaxID=283909 RepID=R7UQP3_CAPTE|nr:hypothetical protein CAPTEDRAFT_223549 [Capitella teleta]|eukprot:ELU05731.1 hypothetical protein CAPTEDRAFT_223549 [Capitella teleta]
MKEEKEKHLTSEAICSYLSDSQLVDLNARTTFMRIESVPLASLASSESFACSDWKFLWFYVMNIHPPMLTDQKRGITAKVTLLRIWDCFLLEGPKVLFRFALAVLKMNEAGLLAKKDTISIMRHLKCCSKLAFDANGLIKTAFEDLKPFPRRRDIAAKQVVYVNALKEKLKRKEASRRSLHQKDEVFSSDDTIANSRLVYECSAECSQGVVWMCLGDQTSGKINVLNCEEGLAHSIQLQIDSRVMCLCTVEQEICIIGTLSSEIIAIGINSKTELWRLRLHDSVLSICCSVQDQRNTLFVGLSDGTLAVLQQVQPREPQEEPVYIGIGRAPITAVLLGSHDLWVSCGNHVHIMRSSTMDSIGQVTVSSNSLDHVLTICRNDPYGIWITIKGSSVVELWDPDNLKCKLLFDVKAGKPISEKKLENEEEFGGFQYEDDDGRLNSSRICAFLPYDGHLWIGTGDGTLLIYSVQQTSKPRSQSYPRAQSGKRDQDVVLQGSAAIVDMEAVMVKMQELHRERHHDLLPATSTETLKTQQMTSSDSSPRKSPRLLKKQHRIEDDAICNGHDHHKVPLAMHKQGLQPVETLLSAKSMTSEMDPTELTLIPDSSAAETNNSARGASHIFSVSAEPHNTATLKAIDEVNSGSPEVMKRGSVPYGSKRWRSRKRIPEVSVQDSSGSMEQDSDTKYSQGSKESSPITIPRPHQYSVPNNTPLKMEQHSLTPWDNSDHQQSLSPNFQRRPSRRAKSDSSGGMARSPSAQGASPSRASHQQPSYYPLDLVLQAKIKIADRPIRSLVRSSSGEESVIISVAGCFGDDEAVLKWKRDRYQENMWTNEPVLEVCPKTNTPRRPSYVKTQSLMRSRSTSTQRSMSDEAF